MKKIFFVSFVLLIFYSCGNKPSNNVIAEKVKNYYSTRDISSNIGDGMDWRNCIIKDVEVKEWGENNRVRLKISGNGDRYKSTGILTGHDTYIAEKLGNQDFYFQAEFTIKKNNFGEWDISY